MSRDPDANATRYLTIQEVSHELHLSRSKVYDLIAREGLPVVRFGRAVRVSVVSLQQWIEYRQVRPAFREQGGNQHSHHPRKAAREPRSHTPQGTERRARVL